MDLNKIKRYFHLLVLLFVSAHSVFIRAASKTKKEFVVVGEELSIQIPKRFSINEKVKNSLQENEHFKLMSIDDNKLVIKGLTSGTVKVVFPRNDNWSWKHRTRSEKEDQTESESGGGAKTPEEPQRNGGAPVTPTKKNRISHRYKTTPPKFKDLTLIITVQSNGSSSPQASEESSWPEKKVYFYDDSESNFTLGQGVSEEKRKLWVMNVETIKVSANPDTALLPKGKSPFAFLNESYDVHSGISINQLIQLVQNIKDDKVRALFFDWDFTLTCLAGVSLPPETVIRLSDLKERYQVKKSISDKNFAVKVLSHWLNPIEESTRKKYILRAFKLANSHAIPIFIITNNKTVAMNSFLISSLFEFNGVKLSKVIFAGSVAPKTKSQVILEFLEKSS